MHGSTDARYGICMSDIKWEELFQLQLEGGARRDGLGAEDRFTMNLIK